MAKGKTSSSTPVTDLNKVMQVKYGIEVDGSTGSALIVNAEADPSDLKLLSSKVSGPEIPLKVSSADYAGFKASNQTVIKRYEKLINDSPVSVMKVTVESEGKDALEYLVIKEQGKIVMQPVRRATRARLYEALEQ